MEKAKSLGGDIIIESIPGKGTKITMRLPVTTAVVQALLDMPLLVGSKALHQKDSTGCTPLYLAACFGHTEVVCFPFSFGLLFACLCFCELVFCARFFIIVRHTGDPEGKDCFSKNGSKTSYFA